jgi:magnesium-transporting ATPase (P-type)
LIAGRLTTSFELPWDYTQSNVEVAVTGPAFMHFVNNKERDPLSFYSVVAKAQIFARMSPIDKA